MKQLLEISQELANSIRDTTESSVSPSLLDRGMWQGCQWFLVRLFPRVFRFNATYKELNSLWQKIIKSCPRCLAPEHVIPGSSLAGRSSAGRNGRYINVWYYD